MTTAFTTLNELQLGNGLALSTYEIESEVLELAVNTINPFYVGTNVKEALESLDVLDNSEISEHFPMHNEEECDEMDIDFYDAEENLDYMHALEIKLEDNTYNWNGNGSNDLEFKVLKSEFGREYVAVSVHIGVDIRGGYTPWVIFNNTYEEFIEALTENTEHVDANGFTITGSLFSECLNVFKQGGDSVEVYGGLYSETLEGLQQEATELLKDEELIK